jgi:hypothetical protein
MKRHLRWMAVALVAAVAAFAAGAVPATSTAQTIPLTVALDDAATVNATLSVSNVSIVNGQAVITGTLSGTVTIAGISGTIPSQSFTLTAAATCMGQTGTLTLTTSPITATLSNGTTATVASETLTIKATCGNPALTVTASSATVKLSDGTTVQSSQCTVSVSTRPNTTLGANICQIQNLICELAQDLAAGSTADVVSLLNQILSSTLAIA